MEKRSIRNIIKLGWLLFYRDFQWRYRLTLLGYLWAIVRPLFVGLPIIVVGKRFNLAGDMAGHTNYELYAFAGLIFFRIFYDAIECPQIVMWRARRILQKVAIPYSAVIVAAGFYVLFNLCIYILLLVAALIVFNVPVQPTAILTILSIPVFIMAGLSVGIPLAPVALFYLDFRYSLGFVSGVFTWMTPIFYVMQTGGAIGMVNRWNPLTYLISMPRYWLIGGTACSYSGFLISLLFFSCLFLMSLWFYYRSLPIAVERVV
jgi:homopolymeric O-antigen transport system permease protein